MNSQKALGPPDSHHLAYAEGWLGLGNKQEAEGELSKISPKCLSHPEVLRVRYHLYESGKEWQLAAETAQALCQSTPEEPLGWVRLAYALHELKRTREAYDTLRPQADKFPNQFVMRYNLACYCCQLGELEEARRWLHKAIALAGAAEIKRMAIDDPDLLGLRAEIAAL